MRQNQSLFELLAPRLRQFSDALHALKYTHLVDRDDARQIAYEALWRVLSSYPTLVDERQLYHYACTAFRRTMVDEVRSRYGRRKHLARHGFQFPPGLVAGLRATGDLRQIEWGRSTPQDCTAGTPGLDPIGLVDDAPGPDEHVERRERAALRWVALRCRLEKLSDRDLKVVALTLFGVRQYIIAELMGVSAPRVNQIVQRFFCNKIRRRSRPVAIYRPAA